MRHFVSTADSRPADPVPGTGKLILFAGLDAEAGEGFCAASIAVRLARNWRCLVVDFDSQSGVLRKYLRPQIIDRKMPDAFHDRITSLDPLKTKSETPNIDLIEWPSLPGTRPFLSLLRSDPADYTLAVLRPDSSKKAVNFFCAADIPVLVMPPGSSALDKAAAFLGGAETNALARRTVYILLNGVQRGGEERETAAWIQSIQQKLQITVSLIGALTYDPLAETSLESGVPILGDGPQGSSGYTFEEIALKIERLLPGRTPEFPKPPKVKSTAGSRLIDVITSSFSRLLSRLEQRITRQTESSRLAQKIEHLVEEHRRATTVMEQMRRDLEEFRSTLSEIDETLKQGSAQKVAEVDIPHLSRKTFAKVDEALL